MVIERLVTAAHALANGAPQRDDIKDITDSMHLGIRFVMPYPHSGSRWSSSGLSCSGTSPDSNRNSDRSPLSARRVDANEQHADRRRDPILHDETADRATPAPGTPELKLGPTIGSTTRPALRASYGCYIIARLADDSLSVVPIRVDRVSKTIGNIRRGSRLTDRPLWAAPRPSRHSADEPRRLQGRL